MPRDVVVVFVHGINVTCQDYYEPLRDRLLKALPRPARGHVIFRAVFWADIVRGRQQEYLHYARESTGFTVSDLHRMVIEGLGDAAAYQKTRRIELSAYNDIQQRVRRTVMDASTDRGDTRPLVFIGHSLGCHIISTFAYDVHKLKQLALTNDRAEDLHPEIVKYADELRVASPFARLDTLAGLVTMGNNMPLFTFTFGPQFVHPITTTRFANANPPFPGPALDPTTKSRSWWLNYYSRNDPLGYPLKPLNDAYDDTPLIEDLETCSEGWWRATFQRGWLKPMTAMPAHTGYWKDRRVATGAAELIHDIVFADEIAAGTRSAIGPTRPSRHKSL